MCSLLIWLDRCLDAKSVQKHVLKAVLQPFDSIAILSEHEERNLKIIQRVGLKAHVFSLHQLLHLEAHFGIAVDWQKAFHFLIDSSTGCC